MQKPKDPRNMTGAMGKGGVPMPMPTSLSARGPMKIIRPPTAHGGMGDQLYRNAMGGMGNINMLGGNGAGLRMIPMNPQMGMGGICNCIPNMPGAMANSVMMMPGPMAPAGRMHHMHPPAGSLP